MRTARTAHPILIALPIVAFAATILAIIGHAITRDIGWYRGAVVAGVAGVATALLAFTIDLVDAENQAAGTQARETGMRRLGCEALALVLLAACATLMFARYERHAALSDAAPLALALLGGIALAAADGYGRALARLSRLSFAIVRYPARHIAITPRAPHPRPVPTLG